MKAITITSPLNLEIRELPVPENLAEKDVLVRVKAAGICGSDMHIYDGTFPIASYPRIIGHEIVGEIVQVGSGISDLRPGDHIVVNPMISCGTCYPCSIGRPNVCTAMKVRGVHVDGGYAEYLRLPRSSVHKISQHLQWNEAVLIEPFTIAAQIVWRGQVAQQDDVLVMGAGPIGLAVLQLVKNIGGRCTITDIFDTRLELAQKMGADRTINSARENVTEVILQETQGQGMSVIVEAVGIPSLLEDAVKIAAPTGRIVVLGFSDQPSKICQMHITLKELEIRGSRLNTYKFPQVIEWFEQKALRPELLVSHVFHFTEAQKALELNKNNPAETCKVLLTFE